ncbi:MAG: iron uptake system protein EfeO [Acidimicrobiia bacterium]
MHSPARRITAILVSAATVAAAVALLAPAAGAVPQAKTKTVKVEIDDDGCPATLKAKAGPVTFEVENTGSGEVSEFEVLSGNRIIGEIENVAPGLTREFSLTLKAGRYTTYCPGGDREKGRLTVTGTADTRLTGAEQTAVDTYRAYLVDQAAQLVALTKTFTTAVDAGDVEGAKAAYVAARMPYERIEPVAETFGDLDPKIDAREGDVPAKDWEGFHKIEQALWVDGSTAGLTEVTADLNEDVQTLANLIPDVELQPAGIANGAVELLNEVSASKITGEEERYSHTDLDDFQANVEGSQAAFEAVKPLLAAKKADLADDIDAEFAAVFTALAPYKAGATFVSYTTLTKDDTKALAQVVDTLAESLSQVSKQVVSQ